MITGFAPSVRFTGTKPESADLNGSSSNAFTTSMFTPGLHGPWTVSNAPFTTLRNDATPSIPDEFPRAAFAASALARPRNAARSCAGRNPVCCERYSYASRLDIARSCCTCPM